MTNPHPLTEKDCFLIQWNGDNYQDEVDLMRAAYDKGRDDQLEQVIGWLDGNLRDYLHEYVCNEYRFAKGIIEDFKLAMRQQQQENNND